MELNKALTYEEQADRFEKSHLCDVVETSSDEEVLEPVHIKLLQFDNKYVIINT